MTTLTAKEAARELRIKESQFRRAVARGELPPPCLKTRPAMWSKKAIERMLEQSPGSEAPYTEEELLLAEIDALDPSQIR